MKKFLILFSFVLTACTASYHSQTLGQVSGNPAVLSREAKIYVALPKDGAYEEKTYAGSGVLTANEVAKAFSDQHVFVVIGEEVEGREKSMASARAIGAQYVIVPTITLWEPRATEWSGKPSRMAINLTLFETSQGTIVSSTALTGRSRIISFTGTSPESLLHDPLAEYVKKLYIVQ